MGVAKTRGYTVALLAGTFVATTILFGIFVVGWAGWTAISRLAK